MGCGCIPPPPLFDLPPPPDPSLIWALLSDEPIEKFEKAHISDCSFDPFLSLFKGGDVYLPALLCVCFVIVALGCLSSAFVYRKRRRQKQCASSLDSNGKINSGSADTVVTGNGTHWSYSSMNVGQSVPVGINGKRKLLAQQFHNSGHFFHATPIVTTAHMSQGALIRTLPPDRNLAHTLGHQHLQSSPVFYHHQHASQYCLHAQPHLLEPNTGYCTLSNCSQQHQQPQYEEIHQELAHQQHYATTPITRSDSLTIFEDLSEQLLCQELQQRRPPPSCRPPPPPPLTGLPPPPPAPLVPPTKPSLTTVLNQQVQQHHDQQLRPTPLPRHPRHSNSHSSSCSFSDELASSASDVELEQLTQVGVLPPNTELHRPPHHQQFQQQQQELRGGRESGYGTGSKVRSNWPMHSPPQNKSYPRSPQQSSSGNSSQNNSPPSTSSGPPVVITNHAKQNMTYV